MAACTACVAGTLCVGRPASAVWGRGARPAFWTRPWPRLVHEVPLRWRAEGPPGRPRAVRLTRLVSR
eukprot:5731533-Alexandrium_andersonii.AAC.1